MTIWTSLESPIDSLNRTSPPNSLNWLASAKTVPSFTLLKDETTGLALGGKLYTSPANTHNLPNLWAFKVILPCLSVTSLGWITLSYITWPAKSQITSLVAFSTLFFTAPAVIWATVISASISWPFSTNKSDPLETSIFWTLFELLAVGTIFKKKSTSACLASTPWGVL